MSLSAKAALFLLVLAASFPQCPSTSPSRSDPPFLKIRPPCRSTEGRGVLNPLRGGAPGQLFGRDDVTRQITGPGGETTGVIYDAGDSGEWYDAVVLCVHGPNVRFPHPLSTLTAGPASSRGLAVLTSCYRGLAILCIAVVLWCWWGCVVMSLSYCVLCCCVSRGIGDVAMVWFCDLVVLYAVT